MHLRAKHKQQAKKVAKEHINELFIQAHNNFSTHPHRSHRYVLLARQIQMKHKVRMPTEHKKSYCKHCYHYIRTGTNGRVRLRAGTLTMYCDHCKKYTRTPFKKLQRIPQEEK